MAPNSVYIGIKTLMALLLVFSWVSLAGAQQVTITSPSSGTAYIPGSTINVTATVTGGSVLGVQVAAQDIGTSPYQLTAPYSLSLTVPPEVVGPRNLFAVALVANQTVVFSPNVIVDIEPSAIPTALKFQQSLATFGYVGQQQKVGVTAAFADGSTLDVTASTRISFASGSSALVSVDSTGLMTALAPGHTTITASFDSLTATLQTVGPTSVPGDLNGDGRVTLDDLLLLETMLGSTPTGPHDARDLNGDGTINNLDVLALLTLCGANCPSLAATTTLLNPSVTQVQYTRPITFTSTVSGSGAPPTGGVSFVVDGVVADVGILGGTDQASVVLNSLSIGTHTVSALYSGDQKNAPSASQAVSVSIAAVPGDVNGDGVVNCLDLDLVKAAFGTKTGQAAFNPSADVNHDGVVNVLDLSYVARMVPAGTTCP